MFQVRLIHLIGSYTIYMSFRMAASGLCLPVLQFILYMNGAYIIPCVAQLNVSRQPGFGKDSLTFRITGKRDVSVKNMRVTLPPLQGQTRALMKQIPPKLTLKPARPSLTRPEPVPTLLPPKTAGMEDHIRNLHKILPCLSCKGRCGNNDRVPKRHHGSCDCHESCVRFSNCCPDIIHMCPQLQINMTTMELLGTEKQTECYTRGSCHSEAKYRLINTCFYNNQVCERSSKSIKTAVPVVDLKTNLSYSNAVCALCNGADTLLSWKIKYEKNAACSSNCSLFHDWNKFSDKLERFHPPLKLEPRHRCYIKSKLRDKCHFSFPQNDIRLACEQGGQSLVHVLKPQDRINNYKNYFCALCNFENIFKLRCGFLTLKLICGNVEVYSLQKLFTVNSYSGIESNICKENEVYIEREQSCQKLVTFKMDHVISYFEVNISLNITDGSELPIEKASSLIKIAEEVYENLQFFIIESRRNWKQGLDYLNIGAKEADNFNGNFVDVSIKISEMWYNISGNSTHTISLLVSVIDKTCNYVEYSLVNTSFNMFGDVEIHNGLKSSPGGYFIKNESIFVCNRKINNWMYNPVLGWVTIISMSISVLSLIIYIVLYNCFPTGNCGLLMLVCCLLVSHLSFLIGPQLTINYAACYVAGALLHYGFLSGFSWMTTIAFDVFYSVNRAAKLEKPTDQKTSVKKLLFPWFFPTLILLVSVAVDLIGEPLIPGQWLPLYGRSLCWFNSNTALLLYFVAPAGVYVLITFILTVITAVMLWFTLKNPPSVEQGRFSVFLKLFVITGLSWTFAFIAVPLENTVMFTLFVICNAGQGFFLLLAIWIPKIRREGSVTSSNMTGTTSANQKSSFSVNHGN